MSYLDYRRKVYQELLSEIDKDRDIKSLRKHIVKEINHIEYLKSYE
tara:strand:- start:3775 stop:3912 length:138 start_codon:yes stop_codon:yes gene_type:complete